METLTNIVGRVLYPAWETGVRRRPTLSILRELERTQYLPQAELEELQLASLRKLLAHAIANVPLHRERLSKAGISADDIRTLDDVRKLPVLSREVLRDAKEAARSTVAPFAEVRKTTGGSSGTPLVFAYDWGSEYWRRAVKLRGYSWAGQYPGVPTLDFWGILPHGSPWSLPNVKAVVDRAIRREHLIDCGTRGDEELDAAITVMHSERPRVLVAYAQAAADLARRVIARGLQKTFGPLSVITAAERLFPADRAACEQAFGREVFETYGSREVMLTAAECGAHDGMHISSENLLVEIVVHEADGRQRAARPGETGEVIVTDLHNYGMPFIRYAIGDLATRHADVTCPCGRTLPKLSSVDGRITETMRDADGRPISSLLFNIALVAAADLMHECQVIQHRDRSVTMRLVGAHGDVEAKVRAVVEPYLKGLPLRFERVPTLALTPAGKRRVVIVEH